MGQLGTMGGQAVADIVCGKHTPSGKLTDTWAKHYRDYPAADDYSYLNGNTGMKSITGKESMSDTGILIHFM